VELRGGVGGGVDAVRNDLRGDVAPDAVHAAVGLICLGMDRINRIYRIQAMSQWVSSVFGQILSEANSKMEMDMIYTIKNDIAPHILILLIVLILSIEFLVSAFLRYVLIM
jgi:hypothetical protein